MGDNPKADIRGANTAGWYSFLTQTGIHQSEENDANDPATFLVSNFHEAVEIITGASKSLPQWSWNDKYSNKSLFIITFRQVIDENSSLNRSFSSHIGWSPLM